MHKKLTLLLAATFIFLLSFSQTISPNENTEFCPLTDITFTVTLPRIADGSTPNVISSTNGPIVISNVSNLVNTSAQTTFTFVGRFRDVNINQVFQIQYATTSNPSATRDLSFKRIKSLYYSTTCSRVPNQATITVPRCEVVNIPISVSNVQWGTAFESPTLCFGSISTFEYQLPSGWSIGANVSNGTNWIAGGNSVTVTSNLSSGNGGSILIRPSNNCGSGLENGITPGQIPISRPRSPMSITGNSTFCSGSSNYSVSGLPPGATVCWTLTSSTGAATIPSSPFCGNPIIVSYSSVGVSTLTATVTDCIETYALPSKQIVTGIPPVDRFIVYGNRFDYTVMGPRNTYTVCPSENLTIYPNIPVDPDNILEHSWEYVSGSYQLFSGGNNFGAYVYTNSTVNATLELRYRYRNDCGWSNYDYVYFTNMNCDGGEQPYRVIDDSENFDFNISPNPAKNTAVISTTGIAANFEVRVFDLITSGLVKFTRYDKGQTQVKLHLGDLKAGTYVVQIVSGNKTKSKQLRIIK